MTVEGFAEPPEMTAEGSEEPSAQPVPPSDGASQKTPSLCYPPGHFYSPIGDPADLLERADTIWDPSPVALGIDFRRTEHERILTEVFPKFIRDYQYPETESETSKPYDFYTGNSQFGWLDARSLFVFLREQPPRRMIEVGSGFSSLLTADVNHRYLHDSIEFECIEPYPRPFLEQGIPGINRLIRDRVERLDPQFFTKLEAGDILFIDSSHVAKIGSDVNFLYFEVLPRLKPGVRVHIHDIFLPYEYPKYWMTDENRSWNEQYLLRALLMYSNAFRVSFGCCYAFFDLPDLVASALGVGPLEIYGGGSFWIERT